MAHPLHPAEPPAILVVDDKPANLLAVEGVLEPIGAHIVKAHSGEGALRELMQRGEDFAVMLLDVQMPGLDGFETARLVRGREALKYLPIIFLTAVSREEAHIVRGYAEDAIDYLVKPFHPDVLRSKVKFFVELHRRMLSARRARAQQELRLDLALESADLGSWTWEAASDRVTCDARCLDHLGVEPDEEPTLRSLRLDDATPPGGGDRLHVEFQARSGRWLAVRARVFARDTEMARMVGTIADITEDKRVEQEREVFLGALGHDLRNPLQAIAVAGHRLAKHDDEVVGGPARTVVRAAGRMATLIDDLLDFVRTRTGGLIVHRQRVDLGKICREVIEETELTHAARSIRLETHGDTEGLWDQGRLGQVVQNLLTNAIHHGDETAPIAVCVQGFTDEVTLSVENHGAPIPAELADRMFEPFVRSDARREGLGLGLHIVKQLALAHGGCVDVSSDEDTTVFRVTLPRLAGC